jgi:hypothetical protein
MVPIAYMPSPIPRQVGWNLFARTIPFARPSPETGAGRLLHHYHYFRGPLSVHSRYGLHARRVALATLCTRGFSSLVASTAALIATGGANQFPGGYTPAVDQRLHGALRFARNRSAHAAEIWALLVSTTLCVDAADENRAMRPSTSVG